MFGGAFITHIAQHCARFFPYIEDLPPPAPYVYLGIRTMTGMGIAVNFPDIGYRFVGLDGRIFVPGELVHQPLLEAGEVEMPHVAEVPVGDGDIDVEPVVEERHAPEPPQHPRRVYHAVRLPQSTQRLLERLVTGQAELLDRQRQQDQRTDRVLDLMGWVIASESERRTEAGLPVRPLPPPRVYSEPGVQAAPSPTQAGPSSSQAGPSSTQAGPSSTQAGPSNTQSPPPATQSPPPSTQIPTSGDGADSDDTRDDMPLD